MPVALHGVVERFSVGLRHEQVWLIAVTGEFCCDAFLVDQ